MEPVVRSVWASLISNARSLIFDHQEKEEGKRKEEICLRQTLIGHIDFMKMPRYIIIFLYYVMMRYYTDSEFLAAACAGMRTS